MHYIIATCIALAACFVVGALVVRAWSRRRKNPFSRAVKVVLTIVIGVVLALAASLAYLQVHYPAGDKAKAALQGSDAVSVEPTSNGYRFDGPGKECALVFYPGAKVDAEAYAPLMLQLADQGIDCFLVEMPFRIAFLGADSAQELIDSHEYPVWIMAGHSMGGVAASGFAAEHADQVDGVVLLAAYPTDQLPGSLTMCSIYGSEDGCLDRGAYEDARDLWPTDSTEVVIAGGNHAGFGDYGPQRSDGVASISPEEQQLKTVEAVVLLASQL